MHARIDTQTDEQDKNIQTLLCCLIKDVRTLQLMCNYTLKADSDKRINICLNAFGNDSRFQFTLPKFAIPMTKSLSNTNNNPESHSSELNFLEQRTSD